MKTANIEFSTRFQRERFIKKLVNKKGLRAVRINTVHLDGLDINIPHLWARQLNAPNLAKHGFIHAIAFQS
tara:strand:+ start:684 stop:896 length:213 start_codon:yes stop_codon:yes gene_type:complete